MKKSILLLAVVFSFGSMNAQMFQFGLKAGANFSNLEGNDISGSTYTSFHFGAVVELKLLENLSLQPELLYSSQGTKIDEAGFKDINYNYFTVPVLAKFYLISKKLSLEVGPQFSFLVNESVSDQFEGETFDFALAGGLGYNITEHFFVQGRYVLGLTEANKDAEVTNRVIQFSVGYKF
ncbi:porin family protein [Flavobacterium capsici]|uniref:Porin family protein n=1 Tax=Flavobacterium capsici TaxID=3075618 RepID=A0AA96F5A7_9FLAO|nr:MULTISPECIES: porin family protein [unclassified Flavobacterium]WNM19007.1 porin family protein [Flavobacterium sp. PMR2A8]WNM23057.1 porin family protein [Flavobacterium sp. PMTSA4]